MDLMEKFKGCLLGVATGDTIGRPFEGCVPVDPKHVMETIEKEELLTYTDDTEMTLNLTKSLLEVGGVNPEHIAKTFAQDFDPSRGYGPNTLWVLQQIRQGRSWELPAREVMDGEGSLGNGAAMRVAPLALFLRGEEMIQATRECSQITHAHPLGIEGAILQAKGVNMALYSKPQEFNSDEFLEELREMAQSEIFKKKLETVGRLLKEQPSTSTIIQELGNGVETFNSVPTALYCFLSSPLDFQKSVLTAVSLGGDADTLGSMTGALSGALNGMTAIPRAWLVKLERGKEIEQLAERLFFLYAKRELGGKCELCLGENDLRVMKMDEREDFSLENLMLLCRQCRKEIAKGVKPPPKRKTGKYRAVYRKSYKRGLVKF
jgi:poly(ADP-ribose) glycohydrolase ARH3